MDIDYFWNKIRKLQGKDIFTLELSKMNKIEQVSNDFLVRISSTNKRSKVYKWEFEKILNFLVVNKSASRIAIFNFNNRRRNSSVIIAILSYLVDDFTYDSINKELKIK
jgi:hypothetical protein